MKTRTSILPAVMLFLLVFAAPAWAFDPELTFRKGAFVLSGEAGYGQQSEWEGKSNSSGVEYWNAGVRFSLLPFNTVAKNTWFHGSLEMGFEPFYQNYLQPNDQFWAGLAAISRYHFLALGRFVPYLELAGAAGGTDLRLPEIRSTFSFLVFVGLGASFFVDDRTAVYLGYRLQHVSNAKTHLPNRGFESDSAVIGVSLFY
jgi:hypothetical protein